MVIAPKLLKILIWQACFQRMSRHDPRYCSKTVVGTNAIIGNCSATAENLVGDKTGNMQDISVLLYGAETSMDVTIQRLEEIGSLRSSMTTTGKVV